MIDAHVHLWRLGANGCVWPTAADGALHRDFTLPELAAVLSGAGVERAILVQSQEDARDTAWLADIAAAAGCIAGVVGWADLADPAAVTAAADRVVGLRPMVQDRDGDWYDDPAIDAGLAAMARHGLVLDALVRPRHLAALDRLAARHPTLAIVVDHAAKPADMPAWRAAIEPLAARANVAVKLSGLLTELRRDDVPMVVAALIEAVGAGRLLWGSDWPVVTTAAAYGEWLALARALVPASHHAAVFGGNAARIYRIGGGGDA